MEKLFKNLKPKSRSEMFWSIIRSHRRMYVAFCVTTVLWNLIYLCIRNRKSSVLPIIVGMLTSWLFMAILEYSSAQRTVNRHIKKAKAEEEAREQRQAETQRTRGW